MKLLHPLLCSSQRKDPLPPSTMGKGGRYYWATMGGAWHLPPQGGGGFCTFWGPKVTNFKVLPHPSLWCRGLAQDLQPNYAPRGLLWVLETQISLHIPAVGMWGIYIDSCSNDSKYNASGYVIFSCMYLFKWQSPHFISESLFFWQNYLMFSILRPSPAAPHCPVTCRGSYPMCF